MEYNMTHQADADNDKELLLCVKNCSEDEIAKQISSRIHGAFDVALARLVESNGSVEKVIQTGEVFGRGLFTEFIIENPNNWTMTQWVEMTLNKVFCPLGDFFDVSTLSDSEAFSVMKRSVLHDKSDESHAALLFTYSFLRGMLLSAFPNGELLLNGSVQGGFSDVGFRFKMNANYFDQFERERVKEMFVTTKKLEL
jgi:hypothetical protein